MKKIDFPPLIKKHKTYLLEAPNTSEAVAKEKSRNEHSGRDRSLVVITFPFFLFDLLLFEFPVSSVRFLPSASSPIVFAFSLILSLPTRKHVGSRKE
jgi:hypothetical protein